MNPDKPNKKTRFINLKVLLGIIVSLLFIIAVEYFIGFAKIFSAWQQLSWPTISLAFLLLFLSYILRATRIHSYYSMRDKGDFFLCTRATLLHNFYNNFLPMRTGELSFPILLKNYFAIEFTSSIGALFIFRILDLHVLVALSLVCIAIFFPSFSVLVVLLLLVWCIIPFVLLKFKKPLEQRLGNCQKNKILEIGHKILTSLPDTQNQLIRAYFWTAVNWLVKLAVLSWIFMQFHPMPGEIALVSVIFGDLTSVLPIHGVAGAGTYEAGVLFGASLLQQDAKPIIAAAINLHLFILGSSALAVLITPLIRQSKKA